MAERIKVKSARRRPTPANFALGILQAVVLAALVVVPLFFNPRTERIFEPDKIAWIICLAAGAAWAAWARFCATYQSGFPRLPAGAARPLIATSMAVGTVLVASTALSIAPAISLWGSYRRGQGLFATLALIVLFGATAHVARSAAARDRILNLICISAMPVALYALLQRFGIDTIPWSQYGDLADVRAFGSLGNAIFLGAYLAMVVPIALGMSLSRSGVSSLRTGHSAGYLVGAGVAFAGLLASQSRGPVIGLAVGLAAGALLVAADTGRRRLALVAIAGGAGGLASLVVLGSAGVPGLGRFGSLLSVASRTAQERLLAWDALALSAADDPLRALFGHGVETLTFVLPPYADTELARLTPTQVFDRAHNVLWEWWVAAGLIGVVAYLTLYVAAFQAGRVLLGWIDEDGEVGSTNRGAFARGAAVTLGSATLAAGAAAFVRPGLMGLAATFGAAIGLVGHAVLVRLVDVRRVVDDGRVLDDGRQAGRIGETRHRWWVVGLLAALITHLVEGSLGVPTIAGELTFWVALGVLAGGVLEGGVLGDAKALLSAGPGGEKVKRRVRGADRERSSARPSADSPTVHAATADGLIVGLGLATIAYAPLVLPFGLAAVFAGRNALLLGLLVVLWVFADVVAPSAGTGRRALARLAVLGGMLLLLLPIRIYAAGPIAAFGVVLLIVTVAAGWNLGVAQVSQPQSQADHPRDQAWRVPIALAGLPLFAIIVWFVALRPVIADAQLPAGLDAAARGDIAGAAARFNRAVELWPWQPSYAHYTTALDRDLFVSEEGTTAERLAAFARAEAMLDKSFGMHPSEAIARRRATLHRDRADRASDATARRRDIDAAENWFQEALRRDPNAPESHAEYAALLERMDDANSARLHFSTALDINPNRIDWWIGLARAALADDDVAAAGEAITALVERVPAEQIDEMLNALAADAEALPIPPYEPLWSLRVRALIEGRTDRADAATATLDDLARRAPNDPRLQRLRAEVRGANE